MLFSMLSRTSFARRAASGDVFENWINRPRSSLMRSSQNGRNTSRWLFNCATVSSRSVEPGCPATKTGSPSAAPVPVDRQVIGRDGGLAVLVDAQQRHVEAPPRELEVVGIAAE